MVSRRANNWTAQSKGERVLPPSVVLYRFTINVALMDIPFAVVVMVTEVFVLTLPV